MKIEHFTLTSSCVKLMENLSAFLQTSIFSKVIKIKSLPLKYVLLAGRPLKYICREV